MTHKEFFAQLDKHIQNPDSASDEFKAIYSSSSEKVEHIISNLEMYKNAYNIK